MNKIAILAILILSLALVSCAKEATQVAEPIPPRVAEVPEQEVEVEEVEEEEMFIPEDAFEIKGVESSNPITVSYKINKISDDVAELESVQFVIRNYGDEAIKPQAILHVFGDSMDVREDYEYDQLPPGYKFIKKENINANIDAPKLKKDINAKVIDMNKELELLGEDSKQFIAITKD